MPGPRKRRDVEGGFLARGFAAVVVFLRFLIPLAWVAGAVAVTLALPELGAEGSAPIGDIVPEDSQAAQAAQAATDEFGFPLATDTAVVQQDQDGLSRAELQRQLGAALATTRGRGPARGELRAAVPINNSPSGRWGSRSRQRPRSPTSPSSRGSAARRAPTSPSSTRMRLSAGSLGASSESPAPFRHDRRSSRRSTTPCR